MDNDMKAAGKYSQRNSVYCPEINALPAKSAIIERTRNTKSGALNQLLRLSMETPTVTAQKKVMINGALVTSAFKKSIFVFPKSKSNGA